MPALILSVAVYSKSNPTHLLIDALLLVQCVCSYRMWDVSLFNLQGQNPHLLLLCIWRINTWKKTCTQISHTSQQSNGHKSIKN